MSSLRKAIDDCCRNCSFDRSSPGTWRQQVTLCAVKSCALWPVRPKTSSPIPESIFRSYGIDSVESQAIQDEIKGVAG